MCSNITIIISIFIAMAMPPPALAGALVVEYVDNFNLEGLLYSSKLAVADFDADGRDDIILSDDYGSFHIFALHENVFEELWISSPLESTMASIKWLGAIEDKPNESRIFLLDTDDQLHRFSYEGYIFSETYRWDLSSEGTLIDAAVIRPIESESDEFIRLVILPDYKIIMDKLLLDDTPGITFSIGVSAPLADLPLMGVWGGGRSSALMTISKTLSEDTDLPIYTLEAVTDEGKNIASYRLNDFNPEQESIASVTLEPGGALMAFGFSLPDEIGFLNMRLWRESEDGGANPGPWSLYAAHRDIGAGDIDGDGQMEFVTIGIDGLVRILTEEHLEYLFDRNPLTPSGPSIIEQGEIYQDAGFLHSLGINIRESDEELSFSRGGMEITFSGGGAEWLPANFDGAPLALITDPYGNRRYPLSRVCIALGFAFRYRADLGIVEVFS